MSFPFPFDNGLFALSVGTNMISMFDHGKLSPYAYEPKMLTV